jgi:hypothetical protein
VPQSTSFKQYLANLLKAPPPGTLSLYLVADEPSVKLEGRPLPDLPLSLAGLVADGGGLSGGTVEERAARLSRDVDDGVIVGESVAKIRVRHLEE